MLWLLRGVWAYRAEIALAVQVLAALRKSARELTRDYIHQKVKTKLKHSLLVVAAQILILAGAFWLNREAPSLGSRLIASAILWAITLFNLFELVFKTIPELRSLHRTLKGKVGYALKYLLEISLVTELLRLNVVFMAVCLAMGISSRTVIGHSFSYLKPWQELLGDSPLHRLPHHRPKREQN